ncbi:MAG: efflux RND transporter permease subunit [Acidobacteriota bacterium]
MLARPVGICAFFIAIVGFAVMAWVRLPVALLPSLAYPAFGIWTAWPEVPPDQVERGITVPIEQALASVRDIRRLQSRSHLGGSLVQVDFPWNADLDAMDLEIRQKLDRILGFLPSQASRPVVMRVNPAERPIMVLALAAGGAGDPSPDELLEWKDIGVEIVARRLEQLAGVARVRVSGGYTREIRIEPDGEKLDAYGLELATIEESLRAANVSLVGGTVLKGAFRYSVEVSGEFEEAEDIGATVLQRPDRPPIRLAEVAEIQESFAPRRGLVRFDGREVLLLLVERRPEANTVRTAAEVRRALESLERELPEARLNIVVDESVFVEESILGVIQALLWGGGLAMLVLALFLRSPSLLLAVAVALPLSLALALVSFDLLGVTLNFMSLSGLALGVGLLVDNAIVVVENISRWRENGYGPLEASASGAAEVAGAIAASTLTTLAVFLPLVFIQGLSGRLFRDQSLAVVCSVGASLLVALTVVPLIASRSRIEASLRDAPRPGVALGLYERLLGRCLKRPVMPLLGVAFFLGLAASIGAGIPGEVVPGSNQRRIAADLTLKANSDLRQLDDQSAALESRLASMPGVTHVLADLGERDESRAELDPRPRFAADLTITLEPGAEVGRALDEIRRLDAGEATLSARAVPTQLEELLREGEADLQIDLSAIRRQDAVATTEAALAALSALPELIHVRPGEPDSMTTLDLQLDREAMARFGLSAGDLDGWIETATRGREVSRLHRIRDDIPIVTRLRVDSLEDLLQQRVSARSGRIPLGELLRVEAVPQPSALRRHRQGPVTTLFADLAPGAGALRAAAAAREALSGPTSPLSPGIRARISGANLTFQRSLRAVAWSLALSVLLVYLILAAQFENLLQPLLVLLVVPIAVGGVALALAATGQSWNLLSLTGCVVLVGIAVNDAIIKVDFIRQRRKDGLDIEEAVIQAGRERFRPVLMTTLTTFLGLLPLAMGWGAGGSLRAPLAIAVIGGLWVATAAALIVVPVAATRFR